jgi:UBX domain-containing protein 7
MDEQIAEFTSITSASPSQAEQYLRLTDNNLEQAIQLFFEDPSLAPASPQPQQTTSTPAASNSRSRPPPHFSDDDGIVHIESDDEIDEDLAMDEADDEAPARAASGTEDDEAIARRLQEEMYQGAGVDRDGVRAPMARTTETLVGGDDYDVRAAIQEQMLRRQQRQQGSKFSLENDHPSTR